jgi:ATP-dependent Lon protease
LPFSKQAIADIIEYGVRVAGRKDKLSTRFNIVADIIREADYWAKQAKKRNIDAEDVEKAIQGWRRRVNMYEDKIQEMIEKDIIMISTKGKKVGQVNGLSVYQLGGYNFGRPTKITAKTSLGRSGIINIEREANLGGRTYNKGVLILSGFLRSRYAQNQPLSIDATLGFEQSYSEVDGDSASSTEVYALLSALSGIPLTQEIAVTGSVNQNGEIQPIGGVNEKIEGFYDVCKAKGLTGNQGVIIPEGNIDDLMLRQEVVDVVKKKKFHIYVVKTIDEGIEILTSVKAGKKTKSGYEKNSINALVEKKLSEYAAKMKGFVKGK